MNREDAKTAKFKKKNGLWNKRIYRRLRRRDEDFNRKPPYGGAKNAKECRFKARRRITADGRR